MCILSWNKSLSLPSNAVIPEIRKKPYFCTSSLADKERNTESNTKGRDLGEVEDQHGRYSTQKQLAIPSQLWLKPLLTELCENQQITATTNGGRWLGTNKSRQSRLTPHCSPSLSQFLACEFFPHCLFFLFFHFSFLHRQQKLETPCFEVILALGSSCALSYKEDHTSSKKQPDHIPMKPEYLSTYQWTRQCKMNLTLKKNNQEDQTQ